MVLYHSADMILFLDHGDDLLAVDGKASGHDLADIAGAEHGNAPADIEMIDIDHFLHLTSCVNAFRSGAADAERADGALAAAGRQNTLIKGDRKKRALPGEDSGAAGIQAQHSRFQKDIELMRSLRGLDPIDKALCIRGPGQIFFEIAETEAVVDALRQYAAESRTAVGQYDRKTALTGGESGSHTGSACTDDQNIVVRCAGSRNASGAFSCL